MRESYSPQFSSIIVDGNSGAVLSSNNPDGIRRPASLTKIMTLYLLFERLDAGKMKLDTEMEVSEHASEQAPTKLGLKPGQTLKVEDAIKGLVTRSANDAAVVIAEAIAGDEDEFAKLMTRKARALGMSKTTYRNASGLPNDEQLTTARDQATLGRAIQDRYPRYYRYFATTVFNYRGQSIRNHNRLLGNVEGVDGIKTGYTRASGFNLVSSMRRGNRHLVGVVLGGRSGGSRDATMRNLLAENLEKGATKRTVAAITERNAADGTVDVAEAGTASRPGETAQSGSALASAEPGLAAMPQTRSIAPAKPSLMAAAAAALPAAAKVEQNKFEPQAKPEPAPLTSGVIQTQSMSAIPGSAEPMKPVKVKTVQVKAGPMKLASAAGSQPVAPPVTNAIPARPEVAETSSAVVANAAEAKAEAAREALRAAMPQQPAGHGTGNGVLGVLPASSLTQAPPQGLARADDGLCRSGAPRPAAGHATERRRQAGRAGRGSHRLDRPGRRARKRERSQAAHRSRPQPRPERLLSKADPFTETIVSKDNQNVIPRPLRRPRSRFRRSGMPDAQARRHFLHDRSQLIRTSRSKFDKAGAASAGFVVFQARSARH